MENEKDLQGTSDEPVETKSEQNEEGAQSAEVNGTQAESTADTSNEPEGDHSDAAQEEEQKQEVTDQPAVEEELPAVESEDASEVAPKESKEETDSEEPVEASPSEKPDETKVEAKATPEVEDSSQHPATDDEHHDEEHHDDDHHDEHIDYSNHSKDELLKEVAKLSHLEDVKKADRELKEIIPHFNEIAHKEEKDAFQKFIADGGEKDGFEYKDEDKVKFDEYVKIIRERRTKFFSNLEKQKDENLLRKNELLEKLRLLVDGEESTTSITALKELQEEWKAIGPVPGQHNRTLWANYNALIDRFYDNRSIYFELKELDRKKNLDGKLALCERAEELSKLEDIHEATKQLNELHDEFKHIGPIPKEDQEPVWQRFKAASDSVYARRREFVDSLKETLKENLDKKLVLVEEVKVFEAFNSDRINEWNAKTKEILDIQKKWEAIGGIPRDKAKNVNKSFWGPFKHFFHNKGLFFKTLEGKREENLTLKQELVTKVEELKESQDWNATAEKLKKLQQEWREIGPVPEKFRNEVFDKFKKACDHFFNKKREHEQESEKEFYDNLKLKEEVCQKLEAIAASREVNVDEVYDLLDEYADIGFVPRRDIKKIKIKFEQAVKHVITNGDNLDEEEKEDLRINLQVNKLRSGPNANRKIHRKENSIRRKISNLENDISTWRNNLQFFANSKNADKLKAEFEQKVDDATQELEHLKRELEVLHQA